MLMQSKVIFFLIWTTQLKCVYLFACLQDSSHPGPSPSSAGVLVPPKVASITSELLAHAKVQLPLNMWVHLKVLSAAHLQPAIICLCICFAVDFLNLPPGAFKNISSFFAQHFLASFHHLCNRIYSFTGQGWNPCQKRKIQSHSFAPIMCCLHQCFVTGQPSCGCQYGCKKYFHYQLNCRLS